MLSAATVTAPRSEMDEQFGDGVRREAEALRPEVEDVDGIFATQFHGDRVNGSWRPRSRAGGEPARVDRL